MTEVLETVEVDVPIRVVYDQWTQFEEFPLFMEGVEKVQQLDDSHLHWVAKIGGVRREWDAKISEQVPDERIAWHSLDGPQNAGTVTFEAMGPSRTKVTLSIDFEPDGLVETVGDKLGIVKARVGGDVERFRDFITARGTETGAWRGEIHDGDTGTAAPGSI